MKKINIKPLVHVGMSIDDTAILMTKMAWFFHLINRNKERTKDHKTFGRVYGIDPELNRLIPGWRKYCISFFNSRLIHKIQKTTTPTVVCEFNGKNLLVKNHFTDEVEVLKQFQNSLGKT